MIVSEYIATHKPNPVISSYPPEINPSELTLTRGTRRIMTQLRSGNSPVLKSYLNKIDSPNHPSPKCPLCEKHDHTSQHLFSCPKITTTLIPLDLWNDPVTVAFTPWGKQAAGAKFEARADVSSSRATEEEEVNDAIILLEPTNTPRSSAFE